jgi:hypothetical protein
MVGGYSGGEDRPLEGWWVTGDVLTGDLGGNVLDSKTEGVEVVRIRLKGKLLLCTVGVVGEGSDCCLGKYSTRRENMTLFLYPLEFTNPNFIYITYQDDMLEVLEVWLVMVVVGFAVE